MSKSAGTLNTTYNSYYIPPRYMPGYHGHVPSLKYDYGETYGNATAKYHQDYRSKTLDASKSIYNKGGQFPTFYTHQPDLVIGNRTRGRDRWLSRAQYRLYNVDHDRKEELTRFDRLSQSQRNFYKDNTGEVRKVEHFQLPVLAEQQFKRSMPFDVMATRYTDGMELPSAEEQGSKDPLDMAFDTQANLRDRAMRDVHFERR